MVKLGMSGAIFGEQEKKVEFAMRFQEVIALSIK